MANARDATTKPLRILAVGGGGTGKTSLFTTIPGKKFLYCFDPGSLNTIAGQDIEYEQFLPTSLVKKVVPLKGADDNKKGKAYPSVGAETVIKAVDRTFDPAVYNEWEEHFESHKAEGYFDQFNVVGMDSITSFADLVMDQVLHLNGRPGKWPEESDWTAALNAVGNVFREFTGITHAHLFASTHIELHEDRKTNRVFQRMTMSQRLRTRIPILFSEVLLCLANADDEGHFYSVQTKSDNDYPFLRTSMRGLDFHEDVTIGDWSHPESSGIGRLLEKATNY